MDVSVKKERYPLYLIKEREQYYNKMAKKGLSLFAIDRCNEVFENKKSDVLYKIIYLADSVTEDGQVVHLTYKNIVEKNIEPFISQGYNLVYNNDKQAILSIEKDKVSDIHTQNNKINRKKAFGSIRGYIFLGLVNILILLYNANNIDNQYIYNYVKGWFIFTSLPMIFVILASIVYLYYFVSMIFKIKILPLKLIYHKLKTLMIVMFIIIPTLLLFMATSFNEKSYPLDDAPKFILTASDIDSNITINDDDKGITYNSFKVYSISYHNIYFYNQYAFSPDGESKIHIQSDYFVFRSKNEARRVYDKQINGLAKSKWQSIEDLTMDEINSGFDKIHYLEYGGYWILKGNVIVYFDVNPYYIFEEERELFNKLALEKLNEKLENRFSG